MSAEYRRGYEAGYVAGKEVGRGDGFVYASKYMAVILILIFLLGEYL